LISTPGKKLALAVLAAAVAAVCAAAASADGVVCPPGRPTLNGPESVLATEGYSISWSSVLEGTAGAGDYYVVERSADPAFAVAVERTSTTRTSLSFKAPGAIAAATPVLYHRIVVHSSCPVMSPAAVLSNTLKVTFRLDCPVPDSAPSLMVSAVNPPALSTYVVSWTNFGSGSAGPGGGYAGLKFRLRRTAPDGVKESLTDSSSASFADWPGVYLYDVRAESACGAAGPWSPSVRVVVGYSPAKLVLVSEAPPIVVVGGPAGADSLVTRFTVKNGGLLSVGVSAAVDVPFLSVSPVAFGLAPDKTREITVTMALTSNVPAGGTGTVTLKAADAELAVPISFFIAANPAASPVAWNDVDADVNARGDSFVRSIVNPNATPAAFLALVRQPWVSVQSVDGQPWQRPMAAGEVRSVRLSIDRSKRRSPMGTEVATVTLFTAGRPELPSNLVVVDDGPQVPYTVGPAAPGGPGGGGSPSGASPATRILFPSLPNAVDAKGIGRFTSDVWLTNSDAARSADVTMLMSPVLPHWGPGPGVPYDTQQVWRLDLTLAPGETRRFRNLLNLMHYEGACSAEVRSNATTVSATAVVNNQPLVAASASRVALAAGTPLLAGAAPRSFGSEMRPVAPGEGARNGDPAYAVSGLEFDANRRTNLLLAETSGYDTKVRVQLFQSNGSPVTKGGQTVDFKQEVPAGQTVQVNAPDLFDDTASYAGPYFWALVTFDSSAADAFGVPAGSVVPLATAIDNRTQDTSLRVGASTRSLNPVLQPALQASSPGRGSLSVPGPQTTLPFDGGPAPLFFPAAHSVGAPLASGMAPVWRTRVTLTNTSTSARQVELTFMDRVGEAVPGATFGVGLTPQGVFSFEDLLAQAFRTPEAGRAFGGVRIENVKNPDGSWFSTWQDVDVQTEVYTVDPNATSTPLGEFRTGMEAYPYWHGYSSFQSNLGTVSMEGAETSSRYRTNLILQEVGGASCEVSVAAYLPGAFTPIAQTTVTLQKFDYFSQELFRSVLGLNLAELTDVRIVVRQTAGDGVFLAFASKINLATGDPANIFLRPALAGTGR
jgi:hypothetical protein